MKITAGEFLKDLSLIPTISALLYILTYAYLVGESYYFKYPVEFIDININIILITSFKILTIFLPLLCVFWFDLTKRTSIIWFLITGIYSIWILGVYTFNVFNPKSLYLLIYSGKAIFLVCLGIIVVVFMIMIVVWSGVFKSTLINKIPSAIIGTTCLLVLSFLAGFVNSSSDKVSYPEFDNGENELSTTTDAPFILLSKSSNGFILGRCDAYDKDFVLIPYDAKMKFRRVKDEDKINFYRHCFDDTWNLSF
ncbi:hypothetical protein [Erwinia rhapontici]|uniref:hypothetical protein n=1 Tax=Erwinia rhapontici TaxID=55212 RepID=UPI0013318CF7|nr:hypothetical protein [Erwinia rhapontici]MBP2155435.1 hypothetical protein [Erwinia rhapontici]